MIGKPLNIAHRGGAQLWPENTLFAFESAAKAGFDGAELDVQLTRDGHLIVFHDFRLNADLCRKQDGTWLAGDTFHPKICDLSFAELQTFEVGRPRPDSPYARLHPHMVARDKEPIPELSSVVAAVRMINPGFRLFVELKTSKEDPSLSASPEAVAEAVMRDLRDADYLERAILVGFDWRGLTHAKTLESNVKCWFSVDAGEHVDLDTIAGAGGNGCFSSFENVSSGEVQRARALGLSFGVWTVNHPRFMRAAIALGLDAICTDRPDLLKQMLD